MITTEEKIQHAAISEFSKFGFAGARVDRIAKTAKINKAMIYYHYKNKEELYESLLLIFANGIYKFIQGLVPDGKLDIDKLYSIISMYIEFVNKLDTDLHRIVLMEISSGGKYFRKIIFHKMIQPLLSLVSENIKSEIEKKSIRPINPYLTFFQIVGSIVFSNIMRIALKGTDIYNTIFNENFTKEYSDNLIGILRHGIELKEQQL